jgi:nucleoid DNA-binding protein
LTKKDIVKTVSESLNLNQTRAKEAVELVFSEICRALCDERRIELRNFGVFEAKQRAARKARNPRTNEEVMVPPRHVVTFQAGKLLEEMVRDLPPMDDSGQEAAQ